MLLTPAIYLAVALTASHLVFSSSPDGEKISGSTESCKTSTIVTLFSEYRSDPTLFATGGIVERQRDEHVWRGSAVPSFQTEYLEGYLKQIYGCDIPEVLKSYKLCKENNALKMWEDRMLSGMTNPVLVATLRNIGGQHELVEISASEMTLLKEILELRPLARFQNQELDKLLLRPKLGMSYYERKVVAGIFANKSCLLAILVSLLLEAQNPVSFGKNILPHLDSRTKSLFLQYMEKTVIKGERLINATVWRHWQCLEEHRLEILPVASLLEILPIDSSAISLLAAKLHKRMEAYRISKQTAAPLNSTSYLLLCDDVLTEVLARVDLSTLIHSVPCVNKQFHSTFTRNFIVQRSQELRERLSALAPLFDPYHLAVLYPWKSIFSSPRQLVKFYLLTTGKSTDKTWLTAALETMTKDGNENEFGIKNEREYANEEMLRHWLRHVELSGLFRDKDFPVTVLVRFFDIIVQDDLKLQGGLNLLSATQLLYMVKHVKRCGTGKVFKLLPERRLRNIITEIIFLEELRMPKEVLEIAENYVLSEYKVKVTLPLDAKQIIAVDMNLLVKMTETTNSKLLINVFNAFSDSNAIGRLEEGVWKRRAPQMINHLLMEDPTAMSPSQFEALLALTDDDLQERCFNFMLSAINRRTARLVMKTQEYDQ